MVLESVNDPNTAKTIVLPEKQRLELPSFNPHDIPAKTIERQKKLARERLQGFKGANLNHSYKYDWDSLRRYVWKDFDKASDLKILRPDIPQDEYGVNENLWPVLRKFTLDMKEYYQSNSSYKLIYFDYLKVCKVLFPNHLSEIKPTEDEFNSLKENARFKTGYDLGLLGRLLIINPDLKIDPKLLNNTLSELRDSWQRMIKGQEVHSMLMTGMYLNIVDSSILKTLEIPEFFKTYCQQKWEQIYKSNFDLRVGSFDDLARLCILSAQKVRINNQGVFLEYNKPQEQRPSDLPKVRSFK